MVVRDQHAAPFTVVVEGKLLVILLVPLLIFYSGGRIALIHTLGHFAGKFQAYGGAGSSTNNNGGAGINHTSKLCCIYSY